MSTITQPQRDLPVIAEVDVCVIGGGPGGLPAAIAAARQGASTLLVERHGFLGGMATAGLIGPILGHTAIKSGTPVIGGLPEEIVRRMSAMGQAWEWEQALKFWGIPFNAEGLKIVADQLVQEAGVQLLFHALFTDAVVEDGCLTHAIVETRSGPAAIGARVFVDATGDADVVARSGAAYTLGRPADGRPMAMGSMFHIGGLAELPDEVRQECIRRMQQGIADGELNLYGAGMGGHGSTMRAGEASVNITRFAGDCTNPQDLTQAELFTRDLTWKVVELWRSVPGAEGLHLIATPAHVGLRESRQLVGVTRITGDDVVAARKHEDSIARCGYWIDIHCPRGLVSGGTVHLCGKDCTQRDCYMITQHAAEIPGEMWPPEGEWFDIPYRSLVPETLDGLLVSGRCISADHQAMAALRVMGPCMAIGEAAGTAAAQAVASSVQPREVDVKALRETLTLNGALV